MADKELKLRARAVERLKVVLERASGCALLNVEVQKVGTAADTLLEAVLAHGAARTILRHVRTWETVEAWYTLQVQLKQSLRTWSIYPIAPEVVLAFIAVRVQQNCGPTIDGQGSSVVDVHEAADAGARH